MLSYALSFFERAVQHRAPSSKQPVPGGYRLEIEPIFANAAAAAVGAGHIAPYEANGQVDVGFAQPQGANCSATVTVPTSARFYRFRLPVRGAFLWSELADVATSFDSVSVAVVADSVTLMPAGTRAQITFTFYVFVPISMTETAASQSLRAQLLAGHVRECLHNANASELRMIEYPSFGRRLQVGSEQRVANELYALEFTVSVKETVKNTRKYELQV